MMEREVSPPGVGTPLGCPPPYPPTLGTPLALPSLFDLQNSPNAEAVGSEKAGIHICPERSLSPKASGDNGDSGICGIQERRTQGKVERGLGAVSFRLLTQQNKSCK